MMMGFDCVGIQKRSAGIKFIAYPVYLGSRIAHHLRISNAEAHAVMKYLWKYHCIFIPMDDGSCFTVQMMRGFARFKYTADKTFRSTSYLICPAAHLFPAVEILTCLCVRFFPLRLRT